MTKLTVRGKGAPDPRLPTHYAGHAFRARDEARWAVFFDELGVRWVYEPEGYTDSRRRYLPDFWLPDFDCFWEVKSDDQYAKAKIDMLGKLTGKTVYVAIGQPGISNALISHLDGCTSCYEDRSQGVYMHSPYWDNYYQWCQCPACGLLGITFEARADRLGCGCFDGSQSGRHPYSPHTQALHDAYTAARGRRWWDPPSS